MTGHVLGLLARLEMMLPYLTSRDIDELSRSTDALQILVFQLERLISSHEEIYPNS